MKKLLYTVVVILCSITVNAQWLLKFQTIHNQIVKVMSSPNDSVCWFITNMDSLYKTNDGGQNWTKLPPSNVSFNPYLLYVLSSDTAFKASNSTLYKTVNGGVSWLPVFTGAASHTPVLYMKNSIEGVLANNGLIYKTINGGNTWSSSAITQPPLPIVNTPQKGSIHGIGDTIWVALSGNGAAYSPDFGVTWNLPANNGLLFNTYGNISFSNTQMGIAIIHNSSMVYVTTDGAANWTASINTLGANQDVLAVNSDLWFIPNPFDHFYIKYSGDSGATWIQQLFDPAGFEELEKSRNGNTVWAGTDQGKIYVNTSQISTHVSTMDKRTISMRISPNPFATYANIYFDKTLSATIQISTAYGEAIKKINFSGSIYTIDRSEMRNGIYFVQVTFDNGNSETRKIIIQ